jgi:hypothetical protein
MARAKHEVGARAATELPDILQEAEGAIQQRQQTISNSELAAGLLPTKETHQVANALAREANVLERAANKLDALASRGATSSAEPVGARLMFQGQARTSIREMQADLLARAWVARRGAAQIKQKLAGSRLVVRHGGEEILEIPVGGATPTQVQARTEALNLSAKADDARQRAKAALSAHHDGR